MARKRFLTWQEDRDRQYAHASSEWKRNRAKALERAAYECEECGANGCRLEVHHVVPPWYGGTHELGNLRVLCCSHHRLAHRELERQGFW